MSILLDNEVKTYNEINTEQLNDDKENLSHVIEPKVNSMCDSNDEIISQSIKAHDI